MLKNLLTHKNAILLHAVINEPHAVLTFVNVTQDFEDGKRLLGVCRALDWRELSRLPFHRDEITFTRVES